MTLSKRNHTQPLHRRGWIWAVCFFLWLSSNLVHSQEEESRSIPNSFLVTTNSTLRAAEGELFLGIESANHTIQPLVWHIPSTGIVTCSTTSEEADYFFHFQEETVQSASKSMKVGILSATVSLHASQEPQTSFWIAWRPGALDQPHPYGISLDKETQPPSSWNHDPFQWTPAASWYFHEKAFMRNQEIIYYKAFSEGWKQERFVREIQLPYRDIQPKSVLGCTRFYQTMAEGEEEVVHIVVPFHPLPYEEREILASLFPQD